MQSSLAYLLAPALGYLLAQTIKYILGLRSGKGWKAAEASKVKATNFSSATSRASTTAAISRLPRLGLIRRMGARIGWVALTINWLNGL